MASPNPTITQMALIKLNGPCDKTKSHEYGKTLGREEDKLTVVDEKKRESRSERVTRIIRNHSRTNRKVKT